MGTEPTSADNPPGLPGGFDPHAVSVPLDCPKCGESMGAFLADFMLGARLQCVRCEHVVQLKTAAGGEGRT